MRNHVSDRLSFSALAGRVSRRIRLGVNPPGMRALFSVAALVLLTCATALAQVRNYSTVVVFGDSLSDTGNFLHLSLDKYGQPVPGPLYPEEDYTLGRFTDGADTFPHANNYFGVWVEQLAAALPGQPPVFNSLDGGTNYAYGDASTANGFSTIYFGGSNQYSVQVENIGQQITDYLATNPHINKHTLFVVYGGAVDTLSATSPGDILNAAVRQTLNIQRLIQAGATQFLVPNLPPLGLIPRFNRSPTASVTATLASKLFNSYLATGIALLQNSYAGRHLIFYQLDVFHLFLQVVASPGSYSLTNVQDPALGRSVNPDTYLFWDDLHPTTRGHNIMATAAYDLMSHPHAPR